MAFSPRAALSGMLQSRRHSERDLPGSDLPVHYPVAHEAVERLLECGRPVVLEEEVADPGETVAADQRGQQPPRIERNDKTEEAEERQGGPDEMKATAGEVCVFAEIEGVELREA